ncbi:hypothetical protein [Photobacterium sp. R1]
MKIVYGNIDKNGNIVSGSGDFTVENVGAGHYKVGFKQAFHLAPSVVGSQTDYDSSNQSPLDNIVFPFVETTGFSANVGGANGSFQNRSFSFIAIGE